MGNPLASFKMHGICPPAAFYVNQSEFLVIKVQSTAASPALAITSRLIGSDGEITRSLDLMGAVAANTLTTKVIPLREGFLLDVCVSAFGSTVQRGVCYVSIGIQFAGGSGQTPFECLAADYVTNTCPLNWPGTPIRSSVDGPGQLVSLASSVPAAGADAVFTVAAGTRLRVFTFAARFTASATVATRITAIQITDGVGLVYQANNLQNITANGSNMIITGPGISMYTTNVFTEPVTMPIGMIMKAGWIIQTNTFSIQAGDQWTAITILGEQWVEA